MMGDWVFDSMAAVVFGVTGSPSCSRSTSSVTLLVAVPLSWSPPWRTSRATAWRRFRRGAGSTTPRSRSVIGDFFASATTIRLAGARDQVAERVRIKSMQRRRQVMRDEALSQAVDAAFSSISSLGAGLVLLVALGQMRRGSFTVGDFVLFSTYLLQVTSYTGFIGYLARSAGRPRWRSPERRSSPAATPQRRGGPAAGSARLVEASGPVFRAGAAGHALGSVALPRVTTGWRHPRR